MSRSTNDATFLVRGVDSSDTTVASRISTAEEGEGPLSSNSSSDAVGSSAAFGTAVIVGAAEEGG